MGFLFGLAPSGVYRAAQCYHWRGALLPHLFTLTVCISYKLNNLGGLFSVALAVGFYTPQALPGTLPCGARTFLHMSPYSDCLANSQSRRIQYNGVIIKYRTMRRPMKKFYFKFYLMIFILIFSTNNLANFQTTKKQARYIWRDHRESFYCGCQFDAHLNVHFKSCHYTPVDKRRAKRIEWEHLVPVSWFGRHRPCWQYAKHYRINPRAYCEQKDPIFKKMMNDLHNLVPAIGEVNKARGAYGFGTIKSHTLYNGCELTIDTSSKKVDPKDNIKGIIARAHLYMAKHYGKQQFSLSPQQYEQYIKWHQLYPPSAWEKTWNQRIFKLQGTDNRFISGAIPVSSRAEIHFF